MDVEHADHGFDAPDDVLGGNELVQQLGFDRQRSQTAGDGHAEAVHAVADHGAQADVVDRGGDAIFGAAGKRDLELARQAVGQLLVQKRQRQPPGVGLHIEGLLGMNAGQRARRDVADRVVAGFARGQADIGQQMQGVGNLRQRHKVKLHVLARGEVAFAAGALVGDGGQLPHLTGGEQAARDLGADHLDAVLALAVDAAAEAEGPELVGRQLARRGSPGPGSGTARYPRERCYRIPVQGLAGDSRTSAVAIL